MSNGASFMFRPVRRCLIFTERIGWATIFSRILCSPSMPGQANALWHFQGVHHDIWDRDFPSPPALVTVRHNGSCVDAVAQTTKQGYLYLFDRASGKPLFPIEERPYPRSDVPGEVTSPTQPSPGLPAPFTRQMLTADLLTTRTPEAHEQAVKEFATFRSGGQFVPIGLNQETVVFPCFLGGAEWGGPAVDRMRGVIYVNANEMACVSGPDGEPADCEYRGKDLSQSMQPVPWQGSCWFAAAVSFARRCGEASLAGAD